MNSPPFSIYFFLLSLQLLRNNSIGNSCYASCEGSMSESVKILSSPCLPKGRRRSRWIKHGMCLSARSQMNLAQLKTFQVSQVSGQLKINLSPLSWPMTISTPTKGHKSFKNQQLKTQALLQYVTIAQYSNSEAAYYNASNFKGKAWEEKII